jgi:hypothetical protein
MEIEQDDKESETVQSTRSGTSDLERECMRAIQASMAMASQQEDKKRNSGGRRH